MLLLFDLSSKKTNHAINPIYYDLSSGISDNDSGDEDHHDEKEYEDDDHDEEGDAKNEDDEEEETEDEEKEENDDSIETLSDSPGCSRTVRKYTLASSLHQRKRKRYTAKEKTKIKAVGVLSSEEKILKAIAIQRACTFKFNSDNPCFVISMSTSYASGKFLVSFLYPTLN